MLTLTKIINILKAKYDFHKPKKKPIIFFDANLVDLFIKNFNNLKNNHTIIYTRYERINLFVLLKCFISCLLKPRDASFEYFWCYINIIKPKVVITFTDNNIVFYRLKKFFPGIKFFSVQSGYRRKYLDFFPIIKKKKKLFNLNCDKIFCANKYYKNFIKKYIYSKFEIIGYWRNNFVNISKKKIKKREKILFISQFREKPFSKHFDLENKLIPIISEFCFYKKICLFILGCHDNDLVEKNYYKNLIKKNNNWFYIPPKKYPKNYEILDKFENIVFIDSTLGYESLGRKKKLAVFAGRSEKHIFPKKEYFGWPKKYKNKNFFFTHKINTKEVYRVMNNIISLSQEDWNKKYFSKIRDITFFDKNNSILRKAITEALK